MKHDWEPYHKQTDERKPSPLLVEAVAFVPNKGRVLELGAGALVDSKYLLDAGFTNVVALDIEKFGDLPNERFSFVQDSFEEFDFPQDSFNLITAQFSLPFVAPNDFALVWKNIKNSLIVGGIFSGQLFGTHDSWNEHGDMNFLTKEDVEKLLDGMEVIKLKEEEYDGKTAAGDTKHWHVFHVIARKSVS